MSGIQTIDVRSKKSLLPADDRRIRRPQPLPDGAEGGDLGQHQDEPGAEDISGGQGSRLGYSAEFLSLFFAEHRRIDGHTSLDAGRAQVWFQIECHRCGDSKFCLLVFACLSCGVTQVRCHFLERFEFACLIRGLPFLV